MLVQVTWVKASGLEWTWLCVPWTLVTLPDRLCPLIDWPRSMHSLRWPSVFICRQPSTSWWYGYLFICYLYKKTPSTLCNVIYRVAQHKIPRQTICNFSATSCSFWSCLILTLSESNSVNVPLYPLHFNYATTLPCKTLTMKITIFIVMLYWNQKKTLLAASSKLCENSLSQDLFKASGPSFHTSSTFFDNVQFGVVDRVLRQIALCCL